MTLMCDSKTVLMADDDSEDCILAAEAFRESGAGAEFFFVENGLQLMSRLHECACNRERLPVLILLDLNMPQKDGREALVEIKTDPALGHLPIVILTTSREKKDIDFAMGAGAQMFLTKPDTFDEWVEMMKSLIPRWL